MGEGLRVEEGGAVVALACDGVASEVDLLQFLEGGELLEAVEGFDLVVDADDLGEGGDGCEFGEAGVG